MKFFMQKLTRLDSSVSRASVLGLIISKFKSCLRQTLYSLFLSFLYLEMLLLYVKMAVLYESVINLINFEITKRKYNKKKTSLCRGIEPRSPAWQAGILTTILTKIIEYVVKEKVNYKYLIQIIPDLSPFLIPLSAWKEFTSFSCEASTYT